VGNACPFPALKAGLSPSCSPSGDAPPPPRMSLRDNGVYYKLRKLQRIDTLTYSVLMIIVSKVLNYMLSIHDEALYKRKIFFADYA
jgi:hypothetical protein